jgi:pimeloyl-ACP methyl ester carboxylesterase
MANALNGMSSMMIREMLTMVDVGALLSDPCFYGYGVPRGDGRLVAVLPGLLGNDVYLQLLRQWLRNVGYSPVRSTLDFNAGCLQRLREQVYGEIVRRLNGSDKRIALIGHSRGGVMAWAIASRLQEKVSHVVLLGSPIATFRMSVASGDPGAPAGPIGRMMMRISDELRQLLDPDCSYPNCGCPLVGDVMKPLSPSTLVLSIHGRQDLLVGQLAQTTNDGENMYVNASHVGLVYNSDVYRAIGRFLTREPLTNRAMPLRHRARQGSLKVSGEP